MTYPAQAHYLHIFISNLYSFFAIDSHIYSPKYLTNESVRLLTFNSNSLFLLLILTSNYLIQSLKQVVLNTIRGYTFIFWKCFSPAKDIFELISDAIKISIIATLSRFRD